LYVGHTYLPIFPTRRSSDLPPGSTLEPRRSRRPARARAARGNAGRAPGVDPARARTAPVTSRAGMNRRYWPRLLAVVSLAILGSDRKSTRLNYSHVKNSYAV